MQMKKYPVSETFLSVQGEGLHAGRKAFFIRLYGCDIQCPWCDTRYAWSGGNFKEMKAEEIAKEALNSGAAFAVVSGGEPCLFDLSDLVGELSRSGIASHLESSAAHEILDGYAAGSRRGGIDFIAASPKLFRKPNKRALSRADELKCIISNLSELEDYSIIARDAHAAKAIWLHPEWSKSSDKKLLGGICDFVKSRGDPWRAGWQMHKNYAAR